MSDTGSDLKPLALICTGLILARIFAVSGTSATVGRPPLGEVLRRPGIAQEPLANLGVDSLAWLELLTTLEAELGLEVSNDFLVETHVSAALLGEALSRSLTTNRSFDNI